MTSTQKTLLAGCLLGCLAASGSFFFARFQDRQRAYYGDAPQKVSVAELAELGATNKHWVELSDAQLGLRPVVELDGGKPSAFVLPVFSRAAGERAAIAVVLRSSRSRSLDEFGLRTRDRATFRGALVEPSESARASLRELLAATYPGHPLADRLWQVDLDFRSPRAAHWSTTFHSAAGGLTVFAVICLLGFVGSFFGRRDTAGVPAFNSVPEFRF